MIPIACVAVQTFVNSNFFSFLTPSFPISPKLGGKKEKEKEKEKEILP